MHAQVAPPSLLLADSLPSADPPHDAHDQIGSDEARSQHLGRQKFACYMPVRAPWTREEPALYWRNCMRGDCRQIQPQAGCLCHETEIHDIVRNVQKQESRAKPGSTGYMYIYVSICSNSFDNICSFELTQIPRSSNHNQTSTVVDSSTAQDLPYVSRVSCQQRPVA